MATTTAAAVKEILDTDLSDTIVEAFIDSAYLIIHERFSGDTALTAAHKTEIEKWLAAHMIASTRERQLTSSKAQSVSAEWQGKTGFGLDATFYGQQVKLLDTEGYLAGLGKRRARIIAVDSWND